MVSKWASSPGRMIDIYIYQKNTKLVKNYYALYLVSRAFIFWEKWKFVFIFSDRTECFVSLIFVTLHCKFIRWRWHFIYWQHHFTVTILHGVSSPQFPANATEHIEGRSGNDILERWESLLDVPNFFFIDH